jgi:DNA-binding transcriptional LysR family regulator
MGTIDLTALEIFKTVAEQGGITKAAVRLHRVQSTGRRGTREEPWTSSTS